MNKVALLKEEIKGILSNKKGRASAITRRELRDYLGFQNDRKLRLIIAELRSEGMPILFATNKPAGYYVPDNILELRECLDSFRSYIIDLCVQRARIKHGGELFLAPAGQAKLF